MSHHLSPNMELMNRGGDGSGGWGIEGGDGMKGEGRVQSTGKIRGKAPPSGFGVDESWRRRHERMGN